MSATATPRVTESTSPISTTEAAFQALADGIVDRFEQHHIPYCLLRNRDDIPKGLLYWADIDFMVATGIGAKRLYQMFADLQPAQMIPYRGVQDSFFFPVLDRFLRVDMYYGDPEYRSVPFATNAEIIAGRWRDRGYMVAPLVYQPYVAGFSKLLWGGEFPDRYAPMLGDVARRQPMDLHRILVSVFGNEMADELLMLAQNDQMLQTPDLSGRCRRALWAKALRTRPVHSLRGLAKQLVIAVLQRIHPMGLDVVVLGPDGSGKTSVCQAIVSMECRRIPFERAEYLGLYHRILPTLSSLASHISGQEVRLLSNPTHPHDNPPHQPIVWFSKFLYYTVDEWISQMTWMRHKLARTNLLLHDRHLVELMIDARRYRFEGRAILPHIIARLAPRPDLVILLDAPAEVVHRRKQDLDMAEIARQRQEYRSLVAGLPNGRVVNGDQPLDDVVNDVLVVIADEARARTRKRYERTSARFVPDRLTP